MYSAYCIYIPHVILKLSYLENQQHKGQINLIYLRVFISAMYDNVLGIKKYILKIEKSNI